METRTSLRLGTRGSDLALAQAKLVAGLLGKTHPEIDVVVVPIRTKGDSLTSAQWRQNDAKAAFTGEIEKELVAGTVDVAVHSMKDLPGGLDSRLVIAATPTRGDARDALVSKGGVRFASMKPGSRLGTSSTRRRAQILAIRPDLEVTEVHGNIGTRIRKMNEGELHGLVLAVAGLERAGLGSMIAQRFEASEMVPAVCQGILALEARGDDAATFALLSSIDDPGTHAAGVCERAFSAELEGDCNVPIGAYARENSDTMTAIGLVARPDGTRTLKVEVSGPLSDPASVGKRLAEKAKAEGAVAILEELRQ